MKFSLLIITLFWTYSGIGNPTADNVIGAWKNDSGILVFSEHYFSYTEFTPTEYKFTYGGEWILGDGQLTFSYEYHTGNPEKVGTEDRQKAKINGEKLTIGETSFYLLDNGTPGKLANAWLFYNRIRDGQPGTPREASNSRKTMKILSGTRFQWIAYNTETKEFSGTGGGTYTTIDGKYTENIDFFSRDNSRVGASLQFDFEIKDDEWHHKGLSSRGDPIYEIWKLRTVK